MNLDTEGAARTGMEVQSRPAHKHLLLQVWCGLLTVAMVVMAAFLTSIKQRSTEDRVSTLKPDGVSPTINTLSASIKLEESSLSYIQLTKSHDGQSWQESPKCNSCSLRPQNNSILCDKNGLYFIYAQVTFAIQPTKNMSKSVILKKDATIGKQMKKLVEGIFSRMTESSVFVGKLVMLKEGDSVSLDIMGDYLKDSTFWGAIQIH